MTRKSFWFHLKRVMEHPWDSLLAFFAAIGALVLAIPRLLWAAVRWLWWGIKTAEMWTVRGVVRAILVLAARWRLCLIFVGIAFIIFYPSTQAPRFQNVDQHVYLSEGRGWSGGQLETAASALLLHAAGNLGESTSRIAGSSRWKCLSARPTSLRRTA